MVPGVYTLDERLGVRVVLRDVFRNNVKQSERLWLVSRRERFQCEGGKCRV